MKLNNESGQMVLEYILIAVIFVGITMTVSSAFQDNEILRNLVAKPWQSLAGMIQNGEWGERSATMNVHPNAFRMHASLQGCYADDGAGPCN
ncbi:MAG: hypothetical protein HRT45_19785 [Bdellovibrionales bacterium]|nr:hypothetical protein [Bdellovibrionales bacterium]